MKRKEVKVVLDIRENSWEYTLWLIVVYAFLLTGCSGVKNSSKVITNKELNADEKMKFDFSFYEGNRFYLNGEFDKAEHSFLQCLSIDSTSAATRYKLASLYLYKKEFEIAENYAISAVNYNDKNIWYTYLLGNLYAHNNKFELGAEVFESLIKENADQLDFYLSLADIYLKQEEYKSALKTLNSLENQFGITEMVSLEKHKIYLHLKQSKNALDELTNLANAYPKNLSFKRLIAEFYVKINDIERAVLIYESILKINLYDGYARLGLAECYFKKDEFDAANKELKLAFESDEVSSEVKLGLLFNMMQSMKGDRAMETSIYELTEILVKKYPDNPDVNTIYADFLLKNNLLKEAKEYLKKVISVRKDKYLVWEQLLLLENEFQNWNDLYIHSKEALEYFPNQSFLYFFNGFSAFQLNKYSEALKSLEFGFKLITKEDPLRLDYLTFIGECHYKLGNKDKAFEIFDKQLIEDADNVMVMNNYAYYLSLEGKNLVKAKQLSLKTIEKEPNNPTYLDTYAWVLFKNKEYEKALEYIEKTITIDLDPSDVVLEHYGDILFFNNKIEEALEIWKKAFEKGKGSGLLEQKINEKNYFE